MSKNAKIEMLRRVPAFAGFRDRQLADLAKLVDEVIFEPGIGLIREGRPGSQAFLLVDGEVEVTLGGNRLATLGRGQFVGEMALLDQSPCSATVTTTTVVKALAMDPGSFATMLDNASVARRVARTLADRLRTQEQAPIYAAGRPGDS